ncbi:MAG: autotransporter protein, partial [Bradyrhizobium sp.]|nr:autotransporter protein [Bradyrhizobium sp.]
MSRTPQPLRGSERRRAVSVVAPTLAAKAQGFQNVADSRPATEQKRLRLGTTSLAALGLVLVATAPSLAAQWVGGASSDWFDAANWTPGVPTGGDTAFIATVTPNATVIDANPNAQAGGVLVGTGFGAGALTIQNGGILNSGGGSVGNVVSAGAVTVTGAGSIWNTGSLEVGNFGTGTLTIQNRGAVNNATATTIGRDSPGTVTVTGAGSTLTSSDFLLVGRRGTGTLMIQNGGVVSNGRGYLGFDGGTGNVTVEGLGSRWVNAANLQIGYNGIGTLAIQNGGVVSNTNGIISVQDGSTGTVTVTGAGSTWTNAGQLLIGSDGGTGALTVQGGGAVSANIVRNAATGTLNIGAASGQAAVAPGTLTTSSIVNAGLITFNHTAANYIFSASITGAGAPVRVEAGTTILTGTNTYTGATSVNGGTLQAGSAAAFAHDSVFTVASGATLALNNIDQTIGSLAGAGNVTLGSATLSAGGVGTDTTFSGVISGPGGFVKLGSGTMILSGINTYTGATAANGGELEISGSIASTAVTVSGGLAYVGTATAGNAVITNGGSLNFKASSTAASATITNNLAIAFNDTSTAGNASITNNAGVSFNSGSTAGSATITNGYLVILDGASTAGSATITNNYLLYFLGTSTAGSAAITNGAAGATDFSLSTGPAGDHKLSAGSLNGSGVFSLGRNELTVGGNNLSTNVTGVIADGGADGGTGARLIKAGTGTLVLSGINTYTGATTVNGGTLEISGSIASSAIANNANLLYSGTATAGSAGITNNGNLTFNATSTAGSASITNNNDLFFINTSTAGNAAITNGAAGTTDFSQSTGPAGNNKLSAGSLDGGGVFKLGQNELTVGGNNLSTNVTGVIADGGIGGGTGARLIKTGTGTMILSGANTYTGPTTVDGGLLEVNGSIASSSLTTVDAGGTLGGTGIVGNTFVNGGTLSPGNSIGTLNISGSFTMTAASTYLVQVSGTTSDLTIVTGTANIAGTVVVDPMTRLSQKTTYTIMSTGGVNGTFNSANLLMANNFARNPMLSYVGNDVLLTLDPGLLSPILPGNASINQRNVAGAIDNGLLAGSNLSNAFGAIFALSGDGLLNGLTQVSGETATGSQQATFDAMNLFMGLMTDPFTAGRGGNAPATTGFADEDNANAYAANGRKRTSAEREAYAMFTKAPPRAFEARWNVWAAGFGGSQTTDGNATLGSNTATSRVGGVAIGADYWLSPQTIAGFALAGGGTNFSVNGAGSGRSDLFQAGAFVRHTIGSAYITAAAAYGW